MHCYPTIWQKWIMKDVIATPQLLWEKRNKNGENNLHFGFRIFINLHQFYTPSLNLCIVTAFIYALTVQFLFAICTEIKLNHTGGYELIYRGFYKSVTVTYGSTSHHHQSWRGCWMLGNNIGCWKQNYGCWKQYLRPRFNVL